MKEKINLIFKPFIIILVLLTIGYTLVNWLFFIKLGPLPVRSSISNVIIPMGLSGLAIWFYLRPRLKLLSFKNKASHWLDFYAFIAWVSIVIPVSIAQHFITTATGELTELNFIEEIPSLPPTKYYSLKRYYIDKESMSFYTSFGVGGRYRENFGMEIHMALPIFKNTRASFDQEPLAWLGLHYSQTISNRLDRSEKQYLYRQFEVESLNDFKHKKVSDFLYFERINPVESKDGYADAIRQNLRYQTNEMVFIGVNEPFEARNGRKWHWFFGSLLIGPMVWLIMILIPKKDKRELLRIKSGKSNEAAKKAVEELISMMKLDSDFFITPILICLNIVVFLLFVIRGLGFISFKGQDLILWGANYGPLTKNGEAWRLLTNVFLHDGVLHLVNNMSGLLIVGLILEPVLGRKKYLLIYLLTGVLGSLTSMWWNDNMISLGASGAIFGLYGVFFKPTFTQIFPY